MDENLQIKKGSSGYSAPGPVGVNGDYGTSAHFSSIPIDSSVSTEKSIVTSRIDNNKSLTDNNNCIIDEEFEVYDIIVDLYGNLGIITSKYPATIELYGNIMFNSSTQDSSIYKAPTDTNGQAILTFNIVGRNYDQSEMFMVHNDNQSYVGGTSPLWHHRWQYGNRNSYGCWLESSNSDIIYYNGEQMTTKSFITKIYNTDKEKYFKICVVFKNGLSFEVPMVTFMNQNQRFVISDGYFNMIDKNLSGLTEYSNVNDEYNSQGQGDTYKKFIKGGDSTYPKLCDIYFEYSHEGKAYRLSVNVTE